MKVEQLLNQARTELAQAEAAHAAEVEQLLNAIRVRLLQPRKVEPLLAAMIQAEVAEVLFKQLAPVEAAIRTVSTVVDRVAWLEQTVLD